MAKDLPKKQRRTWPFKLVFVLGFLILIYPQISDMYYRVDASSEISNFEEEKNSLSEEDVQTRLTLARSFNDSLVNVAVEDPYTKARHNEGRAEYARMLELHEQIGHVQIPVIRLDLPIRAGTADEVLQSGVGHLEGTSLPIGGPSTHTVLTAHSGLPTARLFTDLHKVKLGDRFYIHNLSGTLVYQVDQIKTVKPSQFQDLMVVAGQDYATLLTCTPIMVNSHRLLVRGHRVPYDPAIDDPLVNQDPLSALYRLLVIGILAFIALMLGLIAYYRCQTRRLLAGLADDEDASKEED